MNEICTFITLETDKSHFGFFSVFSIFQDSQISKDKFGMIYKQKCGLVLPVAKSTSYMFFYRPKPDLS